MPRRVSKSLIIGVGGTGQKVLIALKKRMHQRFGQIPDLVKFLSIDADIATEKHEGFEYEFEGDSRTVDIILRGSETVKFGKVKTKSQLEEGIYSNFIPQDIKSIVPIASTGKGAEGKRILGKMLCSSNYSRMRAQINGKIDEVISKTYSEYEGGDSEMVKVYIVGSFAGGAGSSMFIDVANILKTSPHNDALDITGFFSMPEFYKQYPNQHNALANTYGCFLELDYLQSPESNYGELIRTFDNQVINEMRFNSVFIVQNTLSNYTKIDRDTMEDAIAGSISNLISVIGEAADTIGVNNHQFAEFVMKGKRRGYSSFGICEIVLKRNELKQYITNKLILDSLNEYRVNNFSKNEFDKRRDDFIDQNNLDEGVGNEAKVVNELIDSIYKLDCSDLSEVLFPEVDISKDLVTDLKNAYRIFKNSLTDKSDGLKLTYDNLFLSDSKNAKGENVKGIITKLEDLLKALLFSNGGLSRSKLFSESFMNHIELMRKELKREVSDHEDKINEIEETQLFGLYNDVKDNQGWFKKSKLKEIVENYSFVVSGYEENSFRTHYLELIRKEKAIEVYEKLIEVVGKYYLKDGNSSSGMVSVYEKNINELIDKLGLNIRQFRRANKIPFDKININVNYFMIKVLDKEEVFNEIIKHNPLNIAEYLSENPKINNILDELEGKLNENSIEGNTILSNLNNLEYTIDNLLNEFKDVPISIGSDKGGYDDITLKNYLIKEINGNIPIMWNYLDMNIKHEGGMVHEPQLTALIGNCEGEDGFVNYDVVSEFNLKYQIQQGAYTPVATNNPNVISIYIQEHAVPAFKLKNIEMYKNDYEKLKQSTSSYFFTDKRIEQHAPDIFPLKGDEKTMRSWVKGFAMGVILNKRSAYYVKSNTGRTGNEVHCYDQSNASGKNERVNAYNYFSQNEQLNSEVDNRYEKDIKRDPKKLTNDLILYFNGIYESRISNSKSKLFGKKFDSLSREDQGLLFDEEKMILQVIFEDFGVDKRDFFNDNLKEDELADYRRYLDDLEDK